MHLEDGGGVDGLDGAFNGFGDGLGFVFSECEEDVLAGFHDGADSHRDHMVWDFFLGAKESRVVSDRLLGEGFDPCAGGE